MPSRPNKLSRFWLELKRRKVIRAITVYAAAAFIILELTDIVAPSLGLPDWTLNFVIILLCAGFIVAVIVSWIYDIHPEGGIVKTEPAHKVKEEDIPTSSNSWKIASYISFVVIVALIVLNIIPRANNKNEILDKSIAVLPFRNDSPDEENVHFINGTMESILDNLCKIQDLRVPGRTSVEQYRNIAKPIPEIAKELNVSYVLEGSGQKLGNRILLTVQLLDGKSDQHLWTKQYNREIRQVEDLLSISSEIAQLVAAEIEAIITPHEKQLVEEIPTSSLTAFDFYQRGIEQLNHYRFEDDSSALNEAENLFYLALEYDSTFALAYTGLARIYIYKRFWSDYFSDAYMDSVHILANNAIKFDDKLAEAYNIRGDYYYYNGDIEQSTREYKKALKFNPNDWEAYRNIGVNYHYSLPDYVKAIDNFQKAIQRNRGIELPGLLRRLGDIFRDAGFKSQAEKYYREYLTLTNDSASYYSRLAFLERSNGNNNLALELIEKAIKIDSAMLSIHEYYSYLGLYQKQYDIYKVLVKQLETQGAYNFNTTHRLAYACWKLGKYDEAEAYFNEQIRYSEESINLGRLIASWKAAHYDLAGVYAFLGQKDKAYQYLEEFNTLKTYPLWWVTLFKNDLLFDSLKDESEFQQIVRDVESKFQVEHERVRLWLEENDR